MVPPWSLTKDETITSFQAWQHNVIYRLSLDKNFAPFLVDNVTWDKKTPTNQLRGLEADGPPIPAEDRKSAAQKLIHLEMMLGYIANYCTVISRNSIITNSTSLEDVWQKVRAHYGFQKSGAHFLELSNIKSTPDEKPEDLFQRIQAFFEDNLLKVNGEIKHHGHKPAQDEELTPSVENSIVLIWLQSINPGLPMLIRQEYGAALRNHTLASLKPEISIALPSLLDKLQDSKVLRAAVSNSRFSNRSTMRRSFKSCCLCKQAGRKGSSSHSLLECRYLPEYDRKQLGKSRLVGDDDNDSDMEEVPEDLQLSEEVEDALIDKHTARRVNVIQSPYLNVYYKQYPIRLTIDTGDTTNMIRASVAARIGLPVKPASQLARQADGVTPLNVTGEVHCDLTRGSNTFQLNALVVEQLDVDVLAGNPFLVTNDVATRPAKQQIVIHGSTVVYYGSGASRGAAIRRTQAYLLRNPTRKTVLPGDYIELETPPDTDPDSVWALEPRADAPSSVYLKSSHMWPTPQAIQSIDHTVRITNTTDEPILLQKHEHLCQVRPVVMPIKSEMPISDNSESKKYQTVGMSHSNTIPIDPDNILSSAQKRKFKDINAQYDSVLHQILQCTMVVVVILKAL